MNFWSIICQFLSHFWQFFPQFLYRMFCHFNYLLKYCWKSIVKSIIFSIISWYGLVEPGFESSLNPSLNSEGEGLSRVWTQAYNWQIWGSVSDPCLCLVQLELHMDGDELWSNLKVSSDFPTKYGSKTLNNP